jgi:hypothetical protein
VFLLIENIRDGDKSQAELLKERADKYYATMDFRNAVNFYNMALDADPEFEEVYIILHEHYSELEDRISIWENLLRAVEHTDSTRIWDLYEAADRLVIFPNEGVEHFIRSYEVTQYEEGHFSLSLRERSLAGDIWRSDLDEWTYFHVARTKDFNTSLENLEFLKKFRNLERLTIWVDHIADLSALSELVTLRELYITDSGRGNKAQPVNLPSLAQLSQLKILYFANTFPADFLQLDSVPQSAAVSFIFTDIPEDWLLNELTTPVSFILQSNVIDLSNIMQFSGKENLQISLFIADPSDDLSLLYEFEGDLRIRVPYLNITDLSVFSGISALRSLDLHNPLPSRLEPLDLSPLADMTNLEVLRLTAFNIGDISPLAELINLKQLHIAGTVEDFSPIEHIIERLEEFSYAPIE